MEYTKLWLDYQPVNGKVPWFETIYYDDERCETAAAELARAAADLFAVKTAPQKSGNKPEKGIFLSVRGSGGAYTDLSAQAYTISEEDEVVTIASGSGAGVLWGAFELIRMLRIGDGRKELSRTVVPSCPLRMLDHWDNADGSIERGYSGRSFFFRDGEITVNERVYEYARLIASVGINAVVINNVNVFGDAVYFITDRYFDELKKLSDLFGRYGIKLFLSIDYAAPVDIGGLDTADPLDRRVADWWKAAAERIYAALPEFGGFLVKADSEDRPGPFTYGRTQAEGANMLAGALREHGGIVIWRCFVYNCHQDWRDRTTDRARACYDYFKMLDGQFDDNVILQIKNGPLDFQVREPVSPLFGAMPCTNEMLEVQIAQEYTGQQIDLCYLIPQFKEILDFKMHLNDEHDTVADYISGRAYRNRLCGIAAVTNTGDDPNWTGHDLAAANLYGFGRLGFDYSLTAEEIAREWVLQTYGSDPEAAAAICGMLMNSWHTYEKYTAPLGVGWMSAREDHYGPDPDSFEYSRWGTYHYADREGVGVDRTEQGTGYVKQYARPLEELYGTVDTCPDELVLFFHHLPYGHVLKSGETVIQHIYNTHFEGVEDVKRMVDTWEQLKGKIEEDVFVRVRERLQRQLKNASEWRDVINTYFYRKSGIDDAEGRKIYR